MKNYETVSTEQQFFENMRKNEAAAKSAFPNEQWINASSLKIKQKAPGFEIPKNLNNIKIAKSRITPSKNRKTISDNDAKTLAKEIRQAKVLTDRGASVFILPKVKSADGRDISGPDALVNGTLYEFKTITGALKRLETRFRESREQGENVYIRFMKEGITKNDVMDKMYRIINNREYTGGCKGNLIFSVRQGSFEALHYIKIKDLKR